MAGYFAMRYVRSPDALLEDSIFSPPLLPRVLAAQAVELIWEALLGRYHEIKTTCLELNGPTDEHVVQSANALVQLHLSSAWKELKLVQLALHGACGIRSPRYLSSLHRNS